MSIQISHDDSVDMAHVDVARIERLVERVLVSEKTPWTSIGIVLTGHGQLRSMNRTYLNHDFETDVLSFLLDETDEGIEGEVYVDVETAKERYQEFDSSLEREIERYVVHGVLHLAGYNDETPDEKQRMHDLEEEYLNAPV